MLDGALIAHQSDPELEPQEPSPRGRTPPSFVVVVPVPVSFLFFEDGASWDDPASSPNRKLGPLSAVLFDDPHAASKIQSARPDASKTAVRAT
jgi:hypothetical protein